MKAPKMPRLLLFFILLSNLRGLRGDPGSSFIVTLPQTYAIRDPESFLHVIADNSSHHVTGSIVTLTSAPVVMDTQFEIDPGQEFHLMMLNHSQTLPVGTLVTDMTMEITASADVVLVVVNIAGSNGDAYTAIPNDKLGKDYFTVGGAKRDDQTASFITVSAPYDDTEVNVTLPTRGSDAEGLGMVTFDLQGVTYFLDDVITVRLDRLQTLQLQTALDLTGARVTSSKPVAVLSGQNRTNLSGTGCSSHILEQMPPLDHWAKTFVLIHLPNQTESEYYRFVAKEPMTTIIIGDEASGESYVKRIQYAGGFAELDLEEGKFMYVTSDRPILVAQYTREQPRSDVKDIGDPSLLLISPLAHAKDFYRFSISSIMDKQLYVVFTALETDTSLLLLNGEALSSRNVSWNPVVGASEWVVGEVRLTEEDVPCTLGGAGGPRFNAHVYLAAVCECWAMSLTHGETQPEDPPPTCLTTSNIPGDGIDNDCDGSVDEEPCCVNMATDNDGDQYKDEDCSSSNDQICCTSTGATYVCEEEKKSVDFTEKSSFRRQAEGVTNHTARSKIDCGNSCLGMTGCWGVNFAPEVSEGHNCELLSGQGRGLVATQMWGFQYMNLKTSYSG